MTDKEIIIDVNKCKYRDTHSNFCLAERDNIGECYTICTGNDCYFKQLRRKEQEYDRCKQALEKIEEVIKAYDGSDLLKDIRTIVNKVKQNELY